MPDKTMSEPLFHTPEPGMCSATIRHLATSHSQSPGSFEAVLGHYSESQLAKDNCSMNAKSMHFENRTWTWIGSGHLPSQDDTALSSRTVEAVEEEEGLEAKDATGSLCWCY